MKLLYIVLLPTHVVKPTYRLHIGPRVNAALLTYLLTSYLLTYQHSSELFLKNKFNSLETFEIYNFNEINTNSAWNHSSIHLNQLLLHLIALTFRITSAGNKSINHPTFLITPQDLYPQLEPTLLPGKPPVSHSLQVNLSSLSQLDIGSFIGCWNSCMPWLLDEKG